MKIIFLDIDGVINPWKAERDASGKFGKTALDNFKMILEMVPDSFVVISSTWRYHYSLSEIQQFFADAGIAPDRITGVVPDLRYTEGMVKHYPDLKDEVQAWLINNAEVDRFVIIDDVDSEQIEGMESHFFQTIFETGLTYEQSLVIIQRLM
jgi:HAD domain in Swiss Army Knife RNA repair proteins